MIFTIRQIKWYELPPPSLTRSSTRPSAVDAPDSTGGRHGPGAVDADDPGLLVFFNVGRPDAQGRARRKPSVPMSSCPGLLMRPFQGNDAASSRPDLIRLSVDVVGTRYPRCGAQIRRGHKHRTVVFQPTLSGAPSGPSRPGDAARLHWRYDAAVAAPTAEALVTSTRALPEELRPPVEPGAARTGKFSRCQ